MDLSVRKYHFIEALLKVESERIMTKLEKVLKRENDNDTTIPESHIKILNERMEEYRKDPQNLLNWDDIKDKW